MEELILDINDFLMTYDTKENTTPTNRLVSIADLEVNNSMLETLRNIEERAWIINHGWRRRYLDTTPRFSDLPNRPVTQADSVNINVYCIVKMTKLLHIIKSA